MAGLRRWFFGPRRDDRAKQNTKEQSPTWAAKQFDDLIVQGNALEDNGDFDSALARYREASLIAPNSPRAYVNIGNVLQSMGRIDDAIAAQEEAIRLGQDNPAAHFNLGALLRKKAEYVGAERELREALRLRPEMADAAVVLADVLEAEGRLDEAETELRGAVDRSPRSAGAAQNLALLLLKQERIDAAEDVILHAESLNPDFTSLNAILGSICVKTGRAREAELAFRKALSTRGPPTATVSAFLFSLNFRDDLEPESIFLEHKRLGADIEAFVGTTPATFATRATEDRPLKIGYVSGDLRQHPVGQFIRPVLERHDREQFDVHCYANNLVDDNLTQSLKRAAAHWRPIADISDELVADQIGKDGIDILVDLSGHTADARLGVFARRPAPVQATWLGYLNTTGLRSMDYRICDSYTDPPPSTQPLYTERLIRLPHSQWCYQPVHSLPVTQQPHPENPDAIVFGSFNQFAKISDNCLGVWCAVLKAVAKAKLRIYDVPEGRTRSAFVERLQTCGLDPARVSLYGRTGIQEYLGAIGDVDVALDTFPYNGATTTLDTLWMGVPIIGLQGNRAIARGTYSILCSLPAPELVASTAAEYIEKNVRLGLDSPWRRELRGSLRGRLESSPLTDTTTFVSDLESRYRQMWRNWCKRQNDGGAEANTFA